MRFSDCPNERRHQLNAEQLIRRAFAWRGGYDGEAEFLLVRVIGGFEYFRRYETWATGYEVTLTWQTDPPVTGRNQCLTCALEKLLAPFIPRPVIAGGDAARATEPEMKP